MGIMKAPVFPDPVTAPPTTSFPIKAIGIALLWIGVGVVKPTDARPRRTGRDKEKDWKELDAEDFPFARGGLTSAGAKKAS